MKSPGKGLLTNTDWEKKRYDAGGRWKRMGKAFKLRYALPAFLIFFMKYHFFYET